MPALNRPAAVSGKDRNPDSRFALPSADNDISMELAAADRRSELGSWH